MFPSLENATSPILKVARQKGDDVITQDPLRMPISNLAYRNQT
jgi:hypothetical protein